MSYILSPWPKFQYVDDHGNPLANGTLWTYKAGTSTPQVTYNAASGTANSNPVTLDANGSADIWIDDGKAYKYVLKDSQGAIVYSVDQINSQGSGMATVTVLTIATLKALSVSTVNIRASVLGYYASNDGGAGDFLWAPTSTATADDGMVILSNNSATGRWLRIANGDNQINLLWYGAKGDNSTDNVPYIASANAYIIANPTWSMRFPAGTYVLESDPAFGCPVTLDPGAILKWGSPSPFGLPINPVMDNGHHFTCLAGAWAIFDKTISDIRPEWFGAEGDGSLTSSVPGTDDTDYFKTALASSTTGCTILLCGSKKYWIGPIAWKAGINLKSDRASGSSTEAVLCLNAVGDMITLSNSGVGGLQGAEISGVTLDNNGYAGNILTMQTKGSDIHDCTLRNAVGTAIVLGGTQALVNNRITNNVITGCTGGIVDAGDRVGNTGNVISGNVINATAGISLVTINGYSISDNNLTCDTFGIAAFNDQTGTASIDNNLISVSGATGKGIGIVSSGTPSSLSIQNNTIRGDATGINTVGYFPGLIADNVITGCADPYAIDSTIQLRGDFIESNYLALKSGPVVVNDVTPTAGYALDVNGKTYLRNEINVNSGNIYLPSGSLIVNTDQTFNSWIPTKGYIDGFQMSLDSTTVYPYEAHNLTVGAGSCRDNMENVNIVMRGSMTKEILTAAGVFVPWVAGDGNGGVYSGDTTSEGLWMHVFVIQDAGGTTDIYLESNINAPNCPAGYVYRRIGSVYIAEIGSVFGMRRFQQHGDDFMWDQYITGNFYPYYPAENDTILIDTISPDGIKCKANIMANCSVTGTSDDRRSTGYFSDPYSSNKQQYLVYAYDYQAIYDTHGAGTFYLPFRPDQWTHDKLQVWTDTNHQIRYWLGQVNSGDATVYIDTFGYTDLRGKL